MPLDPVSLATAPITGAFQYAGAKKQAEAQTHAADLQAKAAQEALDYTKGQKKLQESAWAPYGAVGSQAASTLPSMIRQSPQMGAPAPYTTQPRATMPMQAASSPLGAMGQAPMPQVPQGGQMVMLQAPDGTQKSVPQDQARYYVSKGAKVIG